MTQPDIFRLLLYKHAQGCSPKLHKLVQTVTVPMSQQEAICAVIEVRLIKIKAYDGIANCVGCASMCSWYSGRD